MDPLSRKVPGMTDASLVILLVEDNPLDAKVIGTNFQESDLRHELHVVPSGEDALKFLYHVVEFAEAPRPHLVLLDLNLPQMTGFEVLAAIKNHEHLQTIPVIVLTASRAEDDKQRAFDLRADRYITKPTDAKGYGELLAAIRSEVESSK